MPVLIRPESHTASHQGIPRLGQNTSEDEIQRIAAGTVMPLLVVVPDDWRGR